jgi:hypothetical protein
VIRAQFVSIVVYAWIAWWYVVPRLRSLNRAEALTALLWVHVFRYVVLYLYVARQEGYAISARALNELVVGDLSGAIVAAAAIILLRFGSRIGLWVSALVVVASVADIAGGIYVRHSDPPRADATGVWWLLFVYFAPLILVSLPLIAWQIYTRRGEPLRTPG